MPKSFAFFLVILFTGIAHAQVKDTLTSKFDTARVELMVPNSDSAIVVKKKVHSPKAATIMSAVIPGLGQVYNKKYWKVPIIYAGLSGLGYLFNYENTHYKLYRDAYIARHDTLAATIDQLGPVYSDEDIIFRRDYFRRYRDLTAIGIFAFYVLNVIDANVDAHMFTFDVSEDLSLNVQPILPFTPYDRRVTGLSFKLKF